MENSPAVRAALLSGILVFAILLSRHYQQSRPLPESAPLPVFVDVQGDVVSPGVYILNGPSATVADAMKAAGGVTGRQWEELSEELLNSRIETGRLLRVMSSSSDGTVEIRFEQMPAAARLTMGLKLDVNVASKDDLLLIPNMKPDVAAAIVNRRMEKAWQSLQELDEISGVGPKTIEKWKPYLSVQ